MMLESTDDDERAFLVFLSECIRSYENDPASDFSHDKVVALCIQEWEDMSKEERRCFLPEVYPTDLDDNLLDEPVSKKTKLETCHPSSDKRCKEANGIKPDSSIEIISLPLQTVTEESATKFQQELHIKLDKVWQQHEVKHGTLREPKDREPLSNVENKSKQNCLTQKYVEKEVRNTRLKRIVQVIGIAKRSLPNGRNQLQARVLYDNYEKGFISLNVVEDVAPRALFEFYEKRMIFESYIPPIEEAAHRLSKKIDNTSGEDVIVIDDSDDDIIVETVKPQPWWTRNRKAIPRHAPSPLQTRNPAVTSRRNPHWYGRKTSSFPRRVPVNGWTLFG